MSAVIVPYETEQEWRHLRAQDLTSSDIAALFGLSPYKTRFELWHEKKRGKPVDIAENERMKWGRRLEATVAHGIALDRGWCIRPMKEYLRVPGERIGSSFDYRILAGKFSTEGERDPDPQYPVAFTVRSHLPDSPQDRLLEIKCVDWLAFRDGWILDTDGFVDAPPHIEIQVQHQLLVAGLRHAFIGVMVGGNDIRVIEREADPAVHAGITAAARDFWRSIDDNQAPDPVMPDDADAVIGMHQFAEPGKYFDGRGNVELAALLREYHHYGQEKNSAEEQQKVRKAQILELIGDHESGITDAGKFSAGMVGPTHVEYDRAGYRNFRFTPTKPPGSGAPKPTRAKAKA